jgi:hypothetical protein
MFKIIDKRQNGRIVQTFDKQSTAIAAYDRINAGWRPTARFAVLPMEDGDAKRADHVIE